MKSSLPLPKEPYTEEGDPEPEPPRHPLSLEEIAARNERNKARILKERQQDNQGVLRSYRIKP